MNTPGDALEPEMVQAMYFYQGSDQDRHQDQYYLPECISAWMALEPTSPQNGTVWVRLARPGGKVGCTTPCMF